jgi:uncharacterized protein (TIGR00369 family)
MTAADVTDIAAAAAAGELDGLAVLRAWQEGQMPPPPIADTIGFTVESAAAGEVAFSFIPARRHYNLMGGVHGGVYATLLDTATACAVHTKLPAGTTFATLDLNVKFLRALNADSGRVTCTGRVVHLGRRTALAHAEMVDTKGRLCAHATSTCLIQRPDTGNPDARR